MPNVVARVLGAWIFVVAVATVAAGAVVCEQVGGPPGEEVTVHLEIVDPSDGALIPPTSGCGTSVTISGTFFVDAPPPLYDFYVVLDASGSAGADSGADVDGDGNLGGPGDTIYLAEIAAAQAFVRALDPAASRVAVIRFNRDATLEHALSADLASVDARLEALKSNGPRWGTSYVDAMNAVEAEVIARGDRARRKQRCIFLSDGVPDENIDQVRTEAQQLADLDVVIDSFALGFPSSNALQEMANITGGTFTSLTNPGDIVALLPSFVPDTSYDFQAAGPGAPGSVASDLDAGTFTATVPLLPGSNVVTLTLAATGAVPVTVECSLTLEAIEPMEARPQGPALACEGSLARLDASASVVNACAAPLYRWLDCAGVEVCPPSSDPTCFVDACAGCDTFWLELACAGETCGYREPVTVACGRVAAPLPEALACWLSAQLSCGGLDPALDVAWDLDAWDDSDGNGIPTDDADLAGCDASASWPTPGPRLVTCRATDPATGCSSTATVDVSVASPPDPRPLDGGACPGQGVLLSCGIPEPGAAYWWDLDAAADGDGDGDGTNDADAAGCDVTTSFAGTGLHDVSGWEEDASGCRRLVAAGTLDIDAGARPGETHDLRVSRSGESITLGWTPVPGASDYRALHGTLDSLWLARAYDHAADDDAGRGRCAVGGGRTHADPDDVSAQPDSYYLVTALNPCGGEGPAGQARSSAGDVERPGRIPSPSCP